MVFLTMYPEEFEHTKEPSYDKDIRWPPVFQLQPFSCLTSSSEKPETDDDCSSQDGSEMAGFVSSKHTTPPSEDEVPLGNSVALDNADATIIKPALLLQEWPVSGGQISDTAQIPSTNFLPPIDLKHLGSFETSDEPLSSGDIMAESEIFVSSKQFLSVETGLLGEFRAW